MKRLILLGATALMWVVPVFGQRTVTIYWEDFDSAATVEDLADWSVGDGWRIDAATPSNGSGMQSLSAFGGPADPAITAPIDTRRLTEGTFSYLARRTSSFDLNSIHISASVDGGLTFPIVIADTSESLDGGSTAWRLKEFALPEALIGEPDVRIRLDNVIGGGGTANVKFDDFAISGMVIFDVEPPEGLLAAEPGDTDQQSFVLTNYGEEALLVNAPILSAPGFSIDPASAVTLLPEQEQVYQITFAPEVDGVVHASLEITTPNAGGVTIPLLGLTAIDQVSFSQLASAAGESEQSVPVDVNLTFSNPEADLNAVEVTMSWDDPILELTDIVPGSAIAGNGWTLSFEAGDQSVKAIVFDDRGGGLSPSHYDPFFTLHFDVGLTGDERDVEIFIDEVLGALAVPTADDAGLFIKEGTHTLLIEMRDAFIVVDEDEIDLGNIEVGETATASFTISNPGGERRLGINSLSFSSGPFSIEPSSAIIEPDASETFTITYAPTLTDFGLADITLNIHHDGEEDGVHVLPVRALSIHGRGDNDGDGMVDVLDLINIIDFILDRSTPTARQTELSDLFPFPDGDGRFDVRDLTLNVQAIVRGVWPDDVALPVTYEREVPDPDASKQLTAAAEVVVSAIDDGSELTLKLETDVPLRALQLHVKVDHLQGLPELRLNTAGSPMASGRADVDLETGLVRLLLYRPDGGTIDAGSYSIATIPRVESGGVERAYATAVDASNRRLHVDMTGLREIGPGGPVLPKQFMVEPPYPNPFSLSGSSVVTIPVQSSEPISVRVEVYDILGRRLEVSDVDVDGRTILQWMARDASGVSVAPGLYLMRIASEDAQYVRRVVVVR